MGRTLMWKISILGGTGNLGSGIAKRAAISGYKVIVGSRKEEKAKRLAKKYNKDLEEIGIQATEIVGMENQEASQRSEMIVVTIPYKYAPSAVESLKLNNKVVISPLVPLKKVGEYFQYIPPPEGSAAEKLQAVCEGTVISAFQNVPARLLDDCKSDISCDVVVCGDDEESKLKVMGFVSDLSNLRALDGGPLSQSRTVESITPHLLNLALRNSMKDVRVIFQG